MSGRVRRFSATHIPTEAPSIGTSAAIHLGPIRRREDCCPVLAGLGAMKIRSHAESHIVELEDGSRWRIFPGDLDAALD